MEFLRKLLYGLISSGSKFTFQPHIFSHHREKEKPSGHFRFRVFHAVYFTPISYAGVDYRFVFSKLRFFN